MAAQYDLPWLAPLAKYGSWKRHAPQLDVGLKRGFTFARHQPHRPFVADSEHGNEMLVAASPDDAVGDTHWLRADFDHFVVQQVSAAGIDYRDHVVLHTIEPGSPWRLVGTRQGEEIDLTADLVVDATGQAGALAKALGIATSPETMRTNSWAVFSHFVEVDWWENVLGDLGGRIDEHPYRCDAAALHHILEEGWMYVLRFDSGVTSAGFLIDGARMQADLALSPEQQWQMLLDRYPSVAQQFHGAQPIRPFERTGRLQRRARQLVGPNWAMLAPASYTLDALFSTGNAHALLTVQRLAHILGRRREGELLGWYAEALDREVTFLDMLVHGAYAAMRCFPLLVAWSMYYFAGAIGAEERRRQGRAGGREEMLSSHLPDFRAGVEEGYERLLALTAQENVSAEDIAAFEDMVARHIAPLNTVGLCDRRRRNLYPYS
jgi:FADH2 O2-dependent halogenase